MDPSDKLRALRARVIWNDYRAQKLVPQGGTCPPTGCVQLNTACAKVNFTDYDQRQAVAQGRQSCGPCATSENAPCY